MIDKELKLHSANKNAAEFIEVVKDKIVIGFHITMYMFLAGTRFKCFP